MAIAKRLVAVTVIFIVVTLAVFGSAAAGGSGEVSLPQRITPETLCPLAGCTQADKGCHASAAAPVPDETFVMRCPKSSGCQDSACHAWDRLTTHYLKPVDFSMNLWIVAPIVFVLALILIVKQVR
jgi:hypothetical protein